MGWKHATNTPTDIFVVLEIFFRSLLFFASDIFAYSELSHFVQSCHITDSQIQQEKLDPRNWKY